MLTRYFLVKKLSLAILILLSCNLAVITWGCSQTSTRTPDSSDRVKPVPVESTSNSPQTSQPESQPAWNNHHDKYGHFLITLRSSHSELGTGDSALLKASANNQSGKALSLNMFLQLGNGLIISSSSSCTGDPCTGKFKVEDGNQALMSINIQSSGPVARSYSVVLHYDYIDPASGDKIKGKVGGLIKSKAYRVAGKSDVPKMAASVSNPKDQGRQNSTRSAAPNITSTEATEIPESSSIHAPSLITKSAPIVIPTPTLLPTKTLPPPMPTGRPKAIIQVTKTIHTRDGRCDSDCSLAEAVSAASSGYAIEIPPGIYTVPGGLSIDKGISLAGAGAAKTIIQTATTQDDATGGVIFFGANHIENPGILSISGVTIRHGDGAINLVRGGTLSLTDSIVTGNTGGGILNQGGTLTLTNSAVTGNVSGVGAGIYSVISGLSRGKLPTVTLTGTTISDNLATTSGGIGAGIYQDRGTLTLVDSTVRGNRAIHGSSGSGNGGGIYASQAKLVITQSTISDNYSTRGGGIFFGHSDRSMTLVNSTVSGNTAIISGGGIAASDGPIIIVNSTIVKNQAGSGGGLHVREGSRPKQDITNTIIADNSAPEGPDCFGEIESQGHNLVGDTMGCDFRSVDGDQVGLQFLIDPHLEALKYNGGPTRTHALLEISPALDSGDNERAPRSDQRGTGRPRGDRSDIGAYER